MTTPINPQFGRSINGARAAVRIGNAPPISAGVRVRGEVLEVAYFGTAPGSAYPIPGTIAGEPARFLKQLDSSVAGMTLLQAEILPVTAGE